MQTFTKAERLTGKTALDSLFHTGKTFNSFPFKVMWLKADATRAQAQIVISVPKRLFKRAVDRNLLKRRIREAYRKNKAFFYEALGDKKVHFLVIYTSKTIMEYKEIEDKIIDVLQRLNKTLNS